MPWNIKKKKEKKNGRNEDARLQYFIVSQTKIEGDRKTKDVMYVLGICIGME